DLGADVAERRFRGDLYARLAEIRLGLPPLRDRREDVLLLLHHALGAPPRRITPALAEALILHAWPYNVREVFALASQLRIAAGAAQALDLDLVADRLPPPEPSRSSSPSVDEPSEPDERDPPPDRAQLEALLRQHKGVVSEVAKAMKRSRKQVYRWIAHHR